MNLIENLVKTKIKSQNVFQIRNICLFTKCPTRVNRKKN